MLLRNVEQGEARLPMLVVLKFSARLSKNGDVEAKHSKHRPTKQG